MRKLEYTAIKIKNFNHWLWFKTEKVTQKDGVFVGKEGWGYQGNLTEITINESEIIGYITSDFPMYN